MAPQAGRSPMPSNGSGSPILTCKRSSVPSMKRVQPTGRVKHRASNWTNTWPNLTLLSCHASPNECTSLDTNVLDHFRHSLYPVGAEGSHGIHQVRVHPLTADAGYPVRFPSVDSAAPAG